MPRTPESPDRIVGRFVGRADALGFAIPPATMRLKLLQTNDHWTLFVQSADDVPASKIVEWLPNQGLLRLEFGSRHVIRADYQPLPEPWARAFKGVALDFARIDPAGESSVTVSGTRPALTAFARRMYGPTAPLELVELREAKARVTFLTTPQDDALRMAVASGYYRIPRALNLEELAKTLGITSASLSERLRRAEGRIITRYVDAGSASPWDEQTLFDSEPADFAAIVWPEPSSSPTSEAGASE